MLCIKSIETEEVKLMLGVSLIIIAAAIVYMVETYISTYYTIEYMHGTSLFLILLAKYGTPVLFLLLCAYIAYRKFLKKQKAAASAASERPASKEELYTNKIQTALTPPTISIVGGVNYKELDYENNSELGVGVKTFAAGSTTTIGKMKGHKLIYNIGMNLSNGKLGANSYSIDTLDVTNEVHKWLADHGYTRTD